MKAAGNMAKKSKMRKISHTWLPSQEVSVKQRFTVEDKQLTFHNLADMKELAKSD